MLELRDVCVSFRSERQEKIFGTSRTQILLMYACLYRRGPVWGFLESPEVGNRLLGR